MSYDRRSLSACLMAISIGAYLLAPHFDKGSYAVGLALGASIALSFTGAKR